jgi:sialate O-acetylesterase
MSLQSLIIIALLFFHHGVHAQLRLPKLISDGMVLQRDSKVKIWGWSSANEKVTVTLSGRSYKTKADEKGNWSVLLAPVKAGGPHILTISAGTTITIKDVLFGDVWFCSGQSNMVHQLNIQM